LFAVSRLPFAESDFLVASMLLCLVAFFRYAFSVKRSAFQK